MIEKKLINHNVSSILTIPDAGTNFSCVILAHGFASEKNEVSGLYKNIANQLYDQGIASIRFDFTGHGDSPKSPEDTSLHIMLDDLNAVHEFICSDGRFNKNKINIVGFSLGAAIAVAYLKIKQNAYNKMILISPCGVIEKDLKSALGHENYLKLQSTKKNIELDLGWRKILLSPGFTKSIGEIYPLKQINQFSGSLLIIVGGLDFTLDSSKQYYANAKKSIIKEIKIINGEDHIFHGLSKNISKLPIVVNETIKWIINENVLVN